MAVSPKGGFLSGVAKMPGIFGGILALVLVSCVAIAGPSPTPPEQPKSGPGGAEYPHEAVTRNVYGEGDDEYWIFEPAKPVPQSAPLIVFNHGWGGTNPKTYGAWISMLSATRRSSGSWGSGATVRR